MSAESVTILINSIILPALGWGLKKLYNIESRLSKLEGRLNRLENDLIHKLEDTINHRIYKYTNRGD